MPTLTEVSRFVAEVTNQAPDDHQPYVGKSAFAHKGGMHVAAMRRNEATYQHLDPALVGNRMRVVVSELSGRGNLLSKAEELGLAGADMSGVLGEIKDLESKGFSFEAAEASVAMMMKRQEPGYQPPFELLDFLVNHETDPNLPGPSGQRPPARPLSHLDPAQVRRVLLISNTALGDTLFSTPAIRALKERSPRLGTGGPGPPGGCWVHPGP